MDLTLTNILARNDPCQYDWTFKIEADGVHLVWHNERDGEAARVHLSPEDIMAFVDLLKEPWEGRSHEWIDGDEGFATITNKQGVKVTHVRRFPE